MVLCCVMAAETELEMADRHVAEGEGHIARQREIIADFARRGQSTIAATDLLRQFEETQAQHVAHRDRILARFRPPT